MIFTDAQQQAINHITGNLQLIACAGSGKTEVVARRVVRLLTPVDAGGAGCRPENIVAFTFTDKAAGELKERIHERCREVLGDVVGLAEMYVGTIHGFCLDLLRLEVPRFLKYEVLNEVQQRLFVDRNSRKSGLTLSTTTSGKPLKRFIDTPHYVAAHAILREDVVSDHARLEACTVARHLPLYEALLSETGYLDYSGILKAAATVLECDQGLRMHLAARIRHIIVDEYQDVNPVQEAVIQVLHQLGATVCVVGDDDQTLYQWRGSDVDNILKFTERYPGVERIQLEENFRSSGGVTSLARDFIKKVKRRLPKEMKAATAQDYDVGDVVALPFNSPDQEAAYIADTCRSLHGIAIRDGDSERGISWSDMAVLLRSVRRDGGPIMAALDAAGIEYVITGMNNLFAKPEAEAARQLFYFLAGEIEGAELHAAWRQAKLGIPTDALASAIANASRARDGMQDAAVGQFKVYNLQRQFMAFLEATGLREEKVPGGRGEVVFYNLGKFSQAISDFESIHFHSKPAEKYTSFAGFLRHRAEHAYPEGWQDVTYATPDAVQIMTVHQAKGLQWPAVFVPQLVRNRFPNRAAGGRTAWHLLPSEAFENAERYRGGVEDERRLFYVAVTRAQKFLHMTWAPTSGNTHAQAPSDFFSDVLASKSVKRRRQDYASRRRLRPVPRASVANVVLSFSDLKYFFECPYQFKLRILYGFNAPLAEAIGYGKSLHDALAEVHKRALEGEIVSHNEAEELVQRHLRTPYAYPALRQKLEAAARKAVSGYLERNSENFRNLEFSEKGIEIALGDGVTVAGRIDLVKRIDTGEVTIVDLKSTDRAQADDVTETQLHIYALGYQELTGRDADYVEIYELDEQTAKTRSVDEEFIADVKRDVGTAADALRQNILEPRPQPNSCGTCDYRNLCSAAIK